ncbi:AraC family transcriptional regulator [Micromonospora sp. 15K316]|uniref:helix-turn-helix transcriptional regulator n=1 Tax=Micromonospora sp. 15K316 TaxID=2530376 RepID=UPI0010479B72|nr:AraC family transcriptional regulator [Micromonospora sp. 15K316]TDC40062.1 AraC family transcriptional regulator [Micromonospora sp. 15K316]
MTRLLDRYMIDGLVAGEARVRVMRPQLRHVPAHWHDYYELGYVLDGSARHVVNGVPRPLGPGGVFLLTPTDFHELVPTSDGPLVCYNVVLDPGVVERWLDVAGIGPAAAGGPPWLADDCADLGADFDRLWRESDGRRPGARALSDAVLGCLLIELGRRADPAGGGDQPGVPRDVAVDVRRAVQYIERHFREPLTLAEVAAHVHLSPNYLSERFGRLVGVSFQTYLQNRRLRFARSLLASTGLGVTEICHAAGFNSPSHFGRAYRRRYGRSPSTGRTAGDGVVTDRR